MENGRRRLWDEYTKYYNDLADQLIKAGIDTKLLKKVIKAYAKTEIYDLKERIKKALKSTAGCVALPILLPISALITLFISYCVFGIVE